MKYFLRICSIVSMIIFTLRLALTGNLSPVTVIFIILAGLLILVGNRTVYIIASATAGLFFCSRVFGAENPATESAIIQGFLALAICLTGIFIMLRSIFPSSRR